MIWFLTTGSFQKSSNSTPKKDIHMVLPQTSSVNNEYKDWVELGMDGVGVERRSGR